ncbi:MAG: ATP-binding cassette domain-containing protein [Acidobacteriota bacterium]|nr:ATP-binding cassette domain-containing protein [Acidobacteriota bacterium]
MSETLARPRFTRTASVLGALVSVLGLGLALVSARALNELANGHVGEGLALASGVVLVRALSGEGLEVFSAVVARRVRQYWRAQVLEFFLAPARVGDPGPLDLASAIDTIVEEPRLSVVRASAQTSILALPVIWWSGGWQALGIVLALLALAVPLYQRAGTRAAAFDAQYRERRERLSQRQMELLAHAPELRALGAVDYGAAEVAALSRAEHAVALRAIRSALGSSLVTEFLSGVSVGLVAMDVGFGLLRGHISLLRALISVLVTSEFFAHVRRYGVEFHRREAIAAALERLVVPAPAQFASGDVLEAVDLVTVAHPQPLAVRVAPGERVAVLGASGIGKTTLAHTLLGWRTARAGRVTRPRGPVAYVSADSALFEGSLGENLRLGRLVPEERLRSLLSSLRLDGDRFSDLDQVVAADGEGFSSGERVRLLIARAVLSEPTLVILDDVAGLLDANARAAVREELARHRDTAIVEIAVDEALLIDAGTKVRLS